VAWLLLLCCFARCPDSVPWQQLSWQLLQQQQADCHQALAGAVAPGAAEYLLKRVDWLLQVGATIKSTWHSVIAAGCWRLGVQVVFMGMVAKVLYAVLAVLCPQLSW
jgi:hypothetical protein